MHWRNADLSRPEVRQLVARTARAHGVPRHLALAVAWQESGWQQARLSVDEAYGVMQVLPTTGAWMSSYAGRRLDLRESGDNVTAGVTLLRVLRSQASSDRRAVAAYYQGLRGLRTNGMYDETRSYVASVLAIRDRLNRTGQP